MEKKNTHLMYGFVTGLIMVAAGAIIYISGVAFKPGMQYVVYIPFLGGIIMNAVAFSKANDGYVTFGNVFGSCFKASAIIVLLSIVWGFVSLKLFPEMKDKMFQVAHDAMAKNPNTTDEQIDMALGIWKKHFTAITIGGIIFWYLLFGAIFSLIGAAVAKKKGAMPEQLN